MTGLEQMLREVVREEIRRLVRFEALSSGGAEVVDEDELELQRRAQEVAGRFRRVRVG